MMTLISQPLHEVRLFNDQYASSICFVNYIIMKKKNKAALSAKTKKVRGIVNMKLNNKKLEMSGFILSILLACAGCSKHNTPTPVPPPKDTTTTATYHDPAQYGTPYGNVPQVKD